MEKHLGRFLLPTEIVHHINEITDDDRVENLEVVTAREHSMIHKSYLKARDARMEKYRARIALNPPHPKRIVRSLEFQGRSLTIREWASELGVDPSVLHMRLNEGWSVERTLTTPKRKHSAVSKTGVFS